MRGSFSKSKIHPGNTKIHFLDLLSLWGCTLDGDFVSPYPRFRHQRCHLASTKVGATQNPYQKGQLIEFRESTNHKIILQRRRNMPRKKKSEDLRHKNIVSLKLTDSELEILDHSAEILGISRSEFLRKSFLEKEIDIHYEIVADMEVLRNLVNEYGKIGSNLNQIAKYFNTGGERSLAMEDEIRQCISDLFTLRKEVLKMAGELNGSNKTH